MGEFGIDKLKEIAVDLADFGESLESKLEDGKLNWVEAIGLIIEGAPKAFSYIDDAEQIKAEIRDLDGEELAELAAHVATELDLKADSIEKIIEAALLVLVALNNFRLAIKEARPEEE